MRKKKTSHSEFRALNKKLSTILKLEKEQLREQRVVERLEREQLRDDQEFKKLEEQQILDLEQLEKKIAHEIGPHPLKKITFKDFGKSVIGAFIGIVSHYTVLEGVHFAETITVTQATGFYIVSFFIGLIMLYYTGFRQVRKKMFLFFLPVRLVLIYLVTLLVIFVVLTIFGTVDHGHVYNQVAVVMMPAIVGACAADLIGD